MMAIFQVNVFVIVPKICEFCFSFRIIKFIQSFMSQFKDALIDFIWIPISTQYEFKRMFFIP